MTSYSFAASLTISHKIFEILTFEKAFAIPAAPSYHPPQFRWRPHVPHNCYPDHRTASLAYKLFFICPCPHQPLDLPQVHERRFALGGRPVHWYLAIHTHHQAAVGEEVEVGDDGVKIQAGFIDNLRFGCPPPAHL